MKGVLLACAALALSLPGLAQTSPAGAEPPLFGAEIDVRVVNVEVVVTDRQGRRVPGLKARDFGLRVDGREVPVEYFSEVEEGRTVAAPAEDAGPEGGEAAAQSVAEGAVGTYYLIFIDDYFSIPRRRNEVLAALKADLGRLGRDDRIALAAYDGVKLALLSNWSNSRTGLEQAFDQAMARPSRGFDRTTERGSFQHDRQFAAQAEAEVSRQGQMARDGGGDDAATPASGMDFADAASLAYAKVLARQIQGVVQAAVGAMRGLAAPRGRKVMLLLAGGWPFSIMSYVTGGSAMPSRQVPEGDALLRPLANTANLLGYTLYPVDVPGVQTGAADAEATAPAAGGFDVAAEQEIEGSLYFLARETGGQPVLNSNRLVALARADADTRSFYWLGFSPSWQHDDRRHEVKVTVRRPGLEVRSRTGFLDLSRQAEVSMKVESALLFGTYPGALPMPMRLGAPVRSKRGELEISVDLGLPVDLMTVIAVNGKYIAHLELRFAASDPKGNTSEIPVLPFDLSSKKPPVSGKYVRYRTNVKIKGEASHMVVLLYDPASGKIATAETDIARPVRR
jgi:VWFA-related protein